MRSVTVAAVLLLLPAALRADEIYLKGGGKLSGIILERTPEKLTIRVGPGSLTLPTSRVERIVPGRSALETYQQRAQQLAADDLDGWLSLARWAQEQDLLTQTREAFERVAHLSPDNPTAQRAIGNVRLGDRWVSPEESY